MHLIQLLLQEGNLFFQRRLPVGLLIGLLLRVLRLAADLCQLDKFINRMLDQLRPLALGIRGNNPVFVLRFQVHIGRYCADDLREGMPVLDKRTRHHAPLKSLYKLEQAALRLFVHLPALLLRKVIHPRADAGVSRKNAVLALNVLHRHPVGYPDAHIALIIHILDLACQPDPVKILRLQFRLFLILFLDKE